MSTSTSTDRLLDTEPSAMLVMAQGQEIAQWSDDKKAEFIGTFKDRTWVGRYLLEQTALQVLTIAQNRKFIGGRHVSQVLGHEPRRYEPAIDPRRFMDTETARSHNYGHVAKIGGRELTDLNKIAEDRAQEILSSLPPLRQAVQIIDPDTAKSLDRIEVLKKQGETLAEQVEEASEPILASEVDQNMTVGAFRKLVHARDKKRQGLLTKLHEVGKEGSELEAQVAKKLYKGLPGLSEAVVEVAKTHFERSTALDEMSRRVEEQVKFGDSDAAVALLRHFEQDEIQVSSSVKAQFSEALNKLKLSVKPAKAKKQIAANTAKARA